jgi:hypothetical protein
VTQRQSLSFLGNIQLRQFICFHRALAILQFEFTEAFLPVMPL